MQLLQLFKNVNKLFKRLNTADKQWDHLDAQKNAIKAIRHEEWYKYIVQYREYEAEQAMQRLSSKSTPLQDIPYWQAKHNWAIDFITRLDNVNS